MFEMKWNMTDRSVKVYNVDAQRMNNRIPKEQYGTSKYNHPSVSKYIPEKTSQLFCLHKCFDSVLIIAAFHIGDVDQPRNVMCSHVHLRLALRSSQRTVGSPDHR